MLSPCIPAGKLSISGREHFPPPVLAGKAVQLLAGYTLGELAALLGGDLLGDPDVTIDGVAPIAEAGPGDIGFIDSPRKLSLAKESKAAAVIAPPLQEDIGKPVLQVANPRLVFARLLELFRPALHYEQGVAPGAHLSQSASLGENVVVMPGVVIAPGARVGSGTILYPGVYIGENSMVGEDCLIYPNVVILHDVEIGDRVIIQPGAVLGGDGFGYVTTNGRHHKVPHVGKVVIEDDVEIGANAAIDRGTCGETRIGRGSKIDNLVQIAHNVKVGRDCLIVGGNGIAGSTVLEDRVTLAGQCGIAGHLTIGHDTVVGARSMVLRDVPPGSHVSGRPARPHMESMRAEAAMRKAPEMLHRIKQLEERLAKLEARERSEED